MQHGNRDPLPRGVPRLASGAFMCAAKPPPTRRQQRLDVTPIKARSASDGDACAPSPPTRRRQRLDVTPIKARSASDGTPGNQARPAMIAGLIVFASAPFSMANGIRCHAVSPDSRRGLLWRHEGRHRFSDGRVAADCLADGPSGPRAFGWRLPASGVPRPPFPAWRACLLGLRN